MNRLDPALFVAAERYAINRWLTGMSETIANQILAHVDVVKADQGCTSAIVADIDELLKRVWPDRHYWGGTHAEWEANRRLWAKVREALLA